MHRRTTPKVFSNAKELRHNLTPAEQKLWVALRNDQLSISFRRQHALGLMSLIFVASRKN